MTIEKITRNISILIIITGHGIVSYYLFYIITIKYEITENRSNIFNKSKESARKTASLYIVAFIFINMGVPPIINFIAEILTCLSLIIKRKIILALTITYIIIFVRLTIIFARETSYGKKQIIEKRETTYHTRIKTIFLIFSTFIIILVY